MLTRVSGILRKFECQRWLNPIGSWIGCLLTFSRTSEHLPLFMKEKTSPSTAVLMSRRKPAIGIGPIRYPTHGFEFLLAPHWLTWRLSVISVGLFCFVSARHPPTPVGLGYYDRNNFRICWLVKRVPIGWLLRRHIFRDVKLSSDSDGRSRQ